jgi:cytochrome c
MIRRFIAYAPFALLAACGPVAEESDDPGAVPAPTPNDVSTAAAPPPPADVAVRPPEFAQCAVCHKVEPGANGLGPSLAGVFGAKAGHVGDFAYSDAMRASDLTWDEATLHSYLEAPARTLPGTRMAYAGLKDPAKRQAVVDYLKTL